MPSLLNERIFDNYLRDFDENGEMCEHDRQLRTIFEDILAILFRKSLIIIQYKLTDEVDRRS